MAKFIKVKDFQPPVHYQVDSLTFGLYNKAQILKLSVVEVFNPSSFNQLGHPLDNALYDLKMGPYSDRDRLVCATCYLNAEHCPGHIGHIILPMPVVNPMFYQTIQRVLRITCLHCHRFKMADCFMTQFRAQMQLLNMGLISQAQEVGDIAARREDTESNKKSKIDSSEVADLDIKLNQYLEQQLRLNAKNKMTVDKGNRTVESLRKDYIKQMWKQGADPVCSRCGSTTKKIVRSKTGFVYEGNKMEDVEDGGADEFEEFRSSIGRRKARDGPEKKELTPADLFEHFRGLYKSDRKMMVNMFPVFLSQDMEHPTDIFFVEVLPVPPPKSRPAQVTEGGLSLHPQTTALQDVIHSTITMKKLVQLAQGKSMEGFSKEELEMMSALRGETNAAKLGLIWKELQLTVDHVLDKNLNAARNATGSSGWGLKQLIERKQGIFRMNMMGKRVNHACRTVITPDPNVKIDEIGIPEVFALKLSYPTPVTPWNVRALREMIINGPLKHPGAIMVVDEMGKAIQLDEKDHSQRSMIANTLLTPTYRNKKNDRPKIVYRHLQNGDAMLLNRQPTLHKPSIMAHKARVLKGEKVMRLHYSNCNSYNADFDGDEMNAHFPQSEAARSESYNIALSPLQYLGPKDGSPLQGLIQDHVIAGVKMTMRGRFFKRPEYLQLIYQALQGVQGKIRLLPPAILKPEVLWSGKQILSTILINLIPAGKPPPNFNSVAKVRPALWRTHPARDWKVGGTPLNDIEMGESEVVIRAGVLCVGILDKGQYGAVAYSLAHLLFELYGGQCSCSFLSGLSQMFTYFLQAIEGFTLGVEDILVRDDANQERADVMAATRVLGDKAASQGVGAKGEVTQATLAFMMEECHRAYAETPRIRAQLDQGYKKELNPATNSINSVCVPAGLIKPFPHNNLQLMVNSGAKGSTVNTTQISCLLGQIELEGKRPPIMISGKSLPSFKAYDTQPRAGGFIDGRFMTGIQPQEFFFHCMAGREGLIDTAVKTSRSGYLQRCLIKLLEGLVVHHDFTVRDSDNSVVQFQYGEDSLDVGKCQYIKPNRLRDLANNLEAIRSQETIDKSRDFADYKGVKRARKKLKEWKKSGRKERVRASPFLEISRRSDIIKQQFPGYEKIKVGKADPVFVSRPKSYLPIHTAYRNCNENLLAELKDETAPRPHPLTAAFLPPVHFSSLTEVCDSMIEDYAKKNKCGLDPDYFRESMYQKVQQSSVAAGEPVGVLAAQSVGEPSTQMTLNTFHFAGRGEMNVTLGIPRLREILMVASNNIKTPSLNIPFKEGVSKKEMERFRLQFNRVLVSDILEEVVVTEKLQLKPSRARKISLRYQFLPHKYYKQDFGVTQAQVLAYMESKFFIKVFVPIMVAISKEKKIGVDVGTDTDIKASRGGGGGGGEDDDDDVARGEQRNQETADKAMGDMDSSDDEGDGEGEGTDVTMKKERQGDREYEELDEEEDKIKEEVDNQLSDGEDKEEEEDKVVNVKESTSDYEEEPLSDDEGKDNLLQAELMSSGEPAKRRLKFLSQMEGVCGLCQVSDYTFDADKETWCQITFSFDVSQKRLDMVNIIKKSAEKGVIHQIKNIKKAFVIEKDGKQQIQTDGINIDVMLQSDKLLQLNKLNCNNIHDMARYYGIEAAYKTIVREVTNVFGVYGIKVDYRHLSLIADYMTIDGSYRPFNRIGIENNPSPLQQMTFETAMGFLRAATLGAKADLLSSPSACIVVGKAAKVGTGSINLRYAM